MTSQPDLAEVVQMDLKVCCEKCRFWSPPIIEGRAGSCHRYPPQVYTHAKDEGSYDETVWVFRPLQTWPQTYDTDWCGEFSLAQQSLEA